MRQLAVFVSLAFSAGLPALALDVSGKVYDKLVNPVSGAKACVKGDPNTCVTTDAEGAFHLAQTVALRPQRTVESGFSLTYRGGSLIVRSPVAVAARLEWLSADGRRRWAAAEADLAPGANALPLPFGLPRAGLVLLRLSTPGQVLTCKVFLASGAAIAGKVSSGAPAIAALSKAAASALEISKAGYRTRTYLPAAETEINVAIVLSDTADADTATAGGMEGPFVNDFGASTNLSVRGAMTTSNEFFKPFGNGRACVSCHRPQDGFTITPKSLQALFHACGLDTDDPSQRPSQADPTACAVFRTNDGSLSAASDVSTAAARRKAYSLLLSRGLIHLTFPVPAGAQFDVVAVNDPYGVATNSTLSVYRRPLPATNLPFLASVMWDMRETATGFLRAPFTPDISHVGSLNDQLKQQAMDATHDHAAAMTPGLTDAQAQSIVDFETSIYSAQTHLAGGGDLSGDGILGPATLAKQSVTPVCGNLDQYDNNPAYPQCQKYTYNPVVFTMFDRWAKAMGTDAQFALKASIARGQALFNTRKAPSPTQRDPEFYEHQNDNVNTTCSTCHTSFNTGGSTVPVGFANVVVGVGPSALNAPTPPADFLDKQLPTYTLRCNSRGTAAYRSSGGLSGCQHDGSEPGIPAEEIQTNDPGRGLITGTWPSTVAFKAPTLRNLAARPPYFHDGSAATLADVVEHYKQAMGFQFTDSEKQDLINFMMAL